MQKKYYLAYGSNLNRNQMRMRCPGAKPLGTAVIEGYRLLFKGSKTGAYLTIEPAEGHYVPVAVWQVTEDDEKVLDRYEGHFLLQDRHQGNLPWNPFKHDPHVSRLRIHHARRQSDWRTQHLLCIHMFAGLQRLRL